MRDSCSIKISYDGDSLQSGKMPVRELAPSLMAFAEAMEEAYKQLSNGEAELTIYVDSNFEKGSFNVNIELVSSIIRELINFFSSKPVTALISFVTILGLLIKGIQKIRGRQIKKARGKEGNIIIELEDGEEILLDPEVFQLYRNVRVRSKLRDTLQPLQKSDISSISIIDKEDKEIAKVTKEQIGYFDIGEKEGEEKLNEFPFEKVYSIVSVSFKEDNKWRLNDGTSTIYAIMKDGIFLQQMETDKISFSKHDLLKVMMNEIQTRNQDNQLKSEYEIIKVIELIKAPTQIKIDYVNE